MNWTGPLSGVRRSPIGLDIGTRSVHAVQLQRASGGWRLAACCRIPRRPQDASELGELLTPDEAVLTRDVLERQGFLGAGVVAALVQSRQVSVPLQLPPRESGAPLGQIARAQAGDAVRCDPALLEFAWWYTPQSRRPGASEGCAALGIAARTADVESMLEPLGQAGLDVLAVDSRAGALARACSPLLPGADAPTVILDIGYRAAVVVVLCGSTIVYERALTESGLAALDRALRNALSLDADVSGFLISRVGLGAGDDVPADQAARWETMQDARELMAEHVASLAREVAASISYAADRIPGDTRAGVLVAGDGAAVPGLARRLGEILDSPARVAAPPVLVQISPGMPDLAIGPAFAAAIGLARHPLEDPT